MLKHKAYPLNAKRVLLAKTAQKEGAEAARGRRARSSNPYPMAQDKTLREAWFRGYDRRLAELTRSS